MMEDETRTPHDGEATGSTPHEQPPQGKPGEIDIHRLADSVYRLALADARLARARGERVGRREER